MIHPNTREVSLWNPPQNAEDRLWFTQNTPRIGYGSEKKGYDGRKIVACGRWPTVVIPLPIFISQPRFPHFFPGGAEKTNPSPNWWSQPRFEPPLHRGRLAVVDAGPGGISFFFAIFQKSSTSKASFSKMRRTSKEIFRFWGKIYGIQSENFFGGSRVPDSKSKLLPNSYHDYRRGPRYWPV